MVFKYNIDTKEGQMVTFSEIEAAFAKVSNLNQEKFRRICILSGCDYIPSIHGIGLGRAESFIVNTNSTDFYEVCPL